MEAANENNHGMSPAAAVAGLKVSAGAQPGWSEISIARHPVFLAAFALIFGGSVISAIFNYLYDEHIVGEAVRDLLIVGYVVTALIGGLRVAGPLPRGFIPAVAAYIAMFIALNTLYVANKISVYVFFAATAWGPVALSYKWPVHMRIFGLRRSSLVSDILVSSVMAAGIFAYFGYLLGIYGFKLTFDADAMLHGIMYSVTMYISIFGLLFYTWNTMRADGLSRVGGMIVLFVLFVALEIPVCAEVIRSHRAPAAEAILGPFVFAGSIAMIMDITFTRARNIFPSLFVITGINFLLVAAGFVK